mgnify:CR=1 FL=1
MTRTRVLATALLLSLVAACGSEDGGGDSTPPAEAGGTVTVDLDDRPFTLHFPASYDPAGSAPLVVLLHGYTSSAAQHEAYFQLTPESDRRGFVYAMPDGTRDKGGKQFWNATDACCDFDDLNVDDSAYLRRLIETVTSAYAVDPARVYLVGHSNGGFMALRMACEHADVVTGVVSVAGSATDDPAGCTPTDGVSVLQIHGDADRIIRYEGGANFGNAYPSAEGVVEMWRTLNGCSDTAETGEPLDLDRTLPGAETTVTLYQEGCRDGARVALWTIGGGGHSPRFTEHFAGAVVDFLYGESS